MTTPTLLLLGDSLTDGERAKDPAGLGRGWPASARRLAEAAGLPAFRWVNRAVGGGRSVEALEAWETRDVPRPDVLVVMVGLNDLWRRHVPWLDHGPVSPQDYGRNLSRLLFQARDAGVATLQVCTPTALHPDPDHPWNRELLEYRAWCREAADACEAQLIPTGEEWDAAVRAHPGVRWTFDGVHPRPVGHERLALTWLAHALGHPRLPSDRIPPPPPGIPSGRWP